jgi:cytochrome P450
LRILFMSQVLGRYNLLDPSVVEDPYPFYSSLLEQSPVYRVPGTEVFLVSSHELVNSALKNHDDYSANLTGVLVTGTNGQPELFDFSQFGGSVDAIANADAPSHSVHRKLLLPQLNTRKVEAMEEELRGWAAKSIQGLVDARRGDWMNEVANRIPVMAMARLVGLPVEDLEQLLEWAFSGGEILAGTTTMDEMVELSVHTAAMSAYLFQHFAEALDNRGEEDPCDVIGELVIGVRQEKITEQEAVSIIIVLVGAAGESTSSLTGNAVRILAEDTEMQKRLRLEPERIEDFLEEVVRLETPFKGHYRVVLNDTCLGDIELPAGSWVILLWAAANRDPTVFNNPDDLDINRKRPREHLGFGWGMHFCIGARLARLEARVMVEELLQRSESFVVSAVTKPQHISSIFVRRLEQLNLEITSA